jgi:hypothetical protein
MDHIILEGRHIWAETQREDTALYGARILIKYWKTLNNGYSLKTIQKVSRVDDVGDTYERCQHDSDVMALSNISAQLPCAHNIQVYEVGALLLLHQSISEEWTRLTNNLICLTLGTFLFLVAPRQYD